MTTSKRIRAAALGPTPTVPGHLASWLGEDEWVAAASFVPQVDESGGLLLSLTPTERRMFLLFVAEAVK